MCIAVNLHTSGGVVALIMCMAWHTSYGTAHLVEYITTSITRGGEHPRLGTWNAGSVSLTGLSPLRCRHIATVSRGRKREREHWDVWDDLVSSKSGRSGSDSVKAIGGRMC